MPLSLIFEDIGPKESLLLLLYFFINSVLPIFKTDYADSACMCFSLVVLCASDGWIADFELRHGTTDRGRREEVQEKRQSGLQTDHSG